MAKRELLLKTADVEPLDVDGVRTLAIGTALWVVAFVVLLPFRGQLAGDDREWWLWTCAVGAVLGGTGVLYCRRRRKKANKKANPPPDQSTSS